MNIKVTIIVLSGMLLASSVDAQKISIGLDSGVGSYAMTDLHNFNSSLVSLLVFDAKVTSDFPSYWYYRPFVKFQMRKFTIGINLGYESTGSRVSSSDYSGSCKMDTKISAFSPALSLEYSLANLYGVKASVGVNTGTHFTKFKYSEELLMKDGTMLADNSVSKKSDSNGEFFVEPQAELSYGLLWFTVAARAGYSYSYSSLIIDELTLNGLVKAPSVDWSGYRFGLSLSYSIFDWSKKVEGVR